MLLVLRAIVIMWNLAGLANASNAEFHAFVVPLSIMTKLTYTATAGTYYNASEANATVDGWERPKGLTEDPKVGLRALVFVHPSTGRGVIAFRGTDLGPGPSGQADRCADALIWGGQTPQYCSAFSAATLDYWGNAIKFVARARATLPTVSFLFTGHSLGAGLALAMSVVTAQRVEEWAAVGFASPAWVLALQHRTRQRPSAHEARRRLYALADEWDPVQRSASRAGGLLGTACLWQSTEPAACARCYAHATFNKSSVDCTQCFAQRHVYAHYLHVDVPGPRPTCKDILEP